MKRLLFLVIILFVCVSAVSAAENSADFAIGVSDDSVCMNDNVIVPQEDSNDGGSNELALVDDGSSEADLGVGDLNVSDLTIQGENVYRYVNAKNVYKFKVMDSNGTGVAVKNVSVTVNHKTTFLDTDENGTGYLPIKGLAVGSHWITVTYKNISTSNKIKLFATKIKTSSSVYTVYGNVAKFTIKVFDDDRNPAANKLVVFTTNVKKYKRYTDENGYAKLLLNYVSGKYFVKFKSEGLTSKVKYVVSNYVSLEIMYWGLKGDVSKAPLIKKNMPNNYWVKKAVKATKKGIPLITIKGGGKNVVFMTSGVHGNELNSQVAAMKMIKYLTEHPIKGTVYIIPFVNVKAISQKVRLTDYDFNRVAHESGTVSNKIIKLILEKKCDAYGDFHTTVSPGVPGINVVLGYTSPGKCVPMTKYISDKADVDRIFYYPGEKYRWSLADYCNLKGTPAVICEVISPVNEVSARATRLSWDQMTAFLIYNKILN